MDSKWFSKCDTPIRSSSTWEFYRNANPQSFLEPTGNQPDTPGWAQWLCFNKSSRRFWSLQGALTSHQGPRSGLVHQPPWPPRLQSCLPVRQMHGSGLRRMGNAWSVMLWGEYDVSRERSFRHQHFSTEVDVKVVISEV